MNGKVLVLIALIIGVFVAYELGTETKTMRVDFSYDPENNYYFADANLPVAIKNVTLHVNYAVTAIPKMTLRVIYEGVPIQIIQGDFRIDSSVVGKLLAVLQNLNGKSVRLYLSLEPNISTVTLPYLEIQYLPFNLGSLNLTTSEPALMPKLL